MVRPKPTDSDFKFQNNIYEFRGPFVNEVGEFKIRQIQMIVLSNQLCLDETFCKGITAKNTRDDDNPVYIILQQSCHGYNSNSAKFLQKKKNRIMNSN